jgi:small subunit ribosomal protein S4
MREKQKVKRIYGLSERQFRNTFEDVTREPGVKGTNLLVALESRLDNIVHRLGFAASRKAARQLIAHGHIEVNGQRVDIPAYRVTPGEEVRVAPAGRELVAVKQAQESASRGQAVGWLSVDADRAAGRMNERPTREAIPINAQEQLVVELYSK